MREEAELGGMVGRLGLGLGMKKAQSLGIGLLRLNRATSYSPTQLPVQYHRG